MGNNRLEDGRAAPTRTDPNRRSVSRLEVNEHRTRLAPNKAAASVLVVILSRRRRISAKRLVQLSLPLSEAEEEPPFRHGSEEPATRHES